jgi:glycosyltransferase involved in cell wall biosynthesis
VVQYMNAADALILASLWEGSPNVVKEAMACSLPVVSVAVGDVPELIGRTEGCYVAGPDARDLGEKLALAVSPRRRTTGRADIAHLEVGAVAQRIIATYHEAASRHHTAGAAVRTPAQEARR